MSDTTPPPNVQNIGLQMAAGSAAGGDVTAGNKTTAGRDMFDIKASDGSTVNVNVNVYDSKPDASATEAASRGLRALIDLMQSPEVRREVIRFKTDLRRTRRELDKIRDYKTLHNCLHTLQFRCYQMLPDILQAFPDAEWAVNQLSDHLGTLEEIVHELRAAMRQPALADQDSAWVEELAQAQVILGVAIETLDKQKLVQTAWYLKRVLKLKPRPINVGLVEAARELQLPLLIRTLAQIQAELPADLDPDKTGQFATGIAALGDLDQRLAGLITHHNRWQDIEVDFQLIEDSLDATRAHDNSLETALAELALVWPGLKAQIARLCGDGTEDWAKGLRAGADKLDQALARNNPGQIKNQFRNYRSAAGRQFHSIDSNLKTLCERMREVGDPLSTLTMIEG